MSDVEKNVLISLDVDSTKADKKQKQYTDNINKTTEAKKKSADATNQQTEATEKYTGAIDGLIGQIGILPAGFTKLISKSNLFIKSLRGVKLAIAATGIGLLVLAVIALQQAFTASEKGQQRWRRITTITGNVVAKLMDILAFLGETLIDVFKNPQESLKQLGKFIQDQLVNRFTGMLELIPNLGKALFQVLSGDFSKAAETAVNALGKVSLGIEDTMGTLSDLKKGTEEYAAELAKVARLSDEVAKQRNQATVIERKLLVERARLESDIADLRLKARQEDEFSAQQRKGFILEAQKLEEDLLKQEQEALKLRLDAQKLENTFARTDEENLDKQAEAEAALFNNQTKRATSARAAQRELNRLNKEIIRDNEKKIKNEQDLAKAQQERFDALFALLDEEDAKEAEKQRLIDEREAAAKEQLLELQFLEQERRALQIQDAQTQADELSRIEDERLAHLLEAEGLTAKEIELVKAQSAQKQRAITASATEAQIKLAQDEAKLKQDVTEASFNLAVQALQTFFGESKEAAIASAAINIALGVTKALSSAPPPLSFINAAAVALAGANQVAQINRAEFADGGMLNGKLHSQGGIPIEAEHGEAIINRRSMANPILRSLASAINEAGGGIAFAQRGMLVGNTERQLTALTENFSTSVNKIQPVLVTEDLQAVLSRVAVTEDLSTL